MFSFNILEQRFIIANYKRFIAETLQKHLETKGRNYLLASGIKIDTKINHSKLSLVQEPKNEISSNLVNSDNIFFTLVYLL